MMHQIVIDCQTDNRTTREVEDTRPPPETDMVEEHRRRISESESLKELKAALLGEPS